jgi:hypothetical protein
MHSGLSRGGESSVHAVARPARVAQQGRREGAQQARRKRVCGHDARRSRVVPDPALARDARTFPRTSGRSGPGGGLLHGLQPPEDPAYRAALLRHPGEARDHVSRPRRPGRLLRGTPVSHGRRRYVRPHRLPDSGPVRRSEIANRALLVPDVSGAARRERSARLPGAASASTPFSIESFVVFLSRNLDRLTPHLVHRVEKRVGCTNTRACSGSRKPRSGCCAPSRA